MVTDSVADLLTRIRNAQLARHKTVTMPNSKFVKSLVDVLHQEGYLGSVEEKKAETGFSELEVSLKYFENGNPLISELKRVSKPGKRIYSGVKELHKQKSGLGISIISTPQGVMTDREARKRNIGGEVLAIIG